VNKAGGKNIAGKKLKSRSEWNDDNGQSGNGTDDYGFSAKPTGHSDGGRYYNDLGNVGSWWGENEKKLPYQWNITRGTSVSSVDWNVPWAYFSVRCVKN